MSDDLRVRVADLLIAGLRLELRKGTDRTDVVFDTLDRAIAIVWNEAIEAGMHKLEGMKISATPDECDLLTDALDSLRALRKREERG